MLASLLKRTSLGKQSVNCSVGVQVITILTGCLWLMKCKCFMLRYNEDLFRNFHKDIAAIDYTR